MILIELTIVFRIFTVFPIVINTIKLEFQFLFHSFPISSFAGKRKSCNPKFMFVAKIYLNRFSNVISNNMMNNAGTVNLEKIHAVKYRKLLECLPKKKYIMPMYSIIHYSINNE